MPAEERVTKVRFPALSQRVPLARRRQGGREGGKNKVESSKDARVSRGERCLRRTEAPGPQKQRPALCQKRNKETQGTRGIPENGAAFLRISCFRHGTKTARQATWRFGYRYQSRQSSRQNSCCAMCRWWRSS